MSQEVSVPPDEAAVLAAVAANDTDALMRAVAGLRTPAGDCIYLEDFMPFVAELQALVRTAEVEKPAEAEAPATAPLDTPAETIDLTATHKLLDQLTEKLAAIRVLEIPNGKGKPTKQEHEAKVKAVKEIADRIAALEAALKAIEGAKFTGHDALKPLEPNTFTAVSERPAGIEAQPIPETPTLRLKAAEAGQSANEQLAATSQALRKIGEEIEGLTGRLAAATTAREALDRAVEVHLEEISQAETGSTVHFSQAAIELLNHMNTEHGYIHILDERLVLVVDPEEVASELEENWLDVIEQLSGSDDESLQLLAERVVLNRRQMAFAQDKDDRQAIARLVKERAVIIREFRRIEASVLPAQALQQEQELFGSTGAEAWAAHDSLTPVLQQMAGSEAESSYREQSNLTSRRQADLQKLVDDCFREATRERALASLPGKLDQLLPLGSLRDPEPGSPQLSVEVLKQTLITLLQDKLGQPTIPEDQLRADILTIINRNFQLSLDSAQADLDRARADSVPSLAIIDGRIVSTAEQYADLLIQVYPDMDSYDAVSVIPGTAIDVLVQGYADGIARAERAIRSMTAEEAGRLPGLLTVVKERFLGVHNRIAPMHSAAVSGEERIKDESGRQIEEQKRLQAEEAEKKASAGLVAGMVKVAGKLQQQFDSTVEALTGALKDNTEDDDLTVAEDAMRSLLGQISEFVAQVATRPDFDAQQVAAIEQSISSLTRGGGRSRWRHAVVGIQAAEAILHGAPTEGEAASPTVTLESQTRICTEAAETIGRLVQIIDHQRSLVDSAKQVMESGSPPTEFDSADVQGKVAAAQDLILEQRALLEGVALEVIGDDPKRLDTAYREACDQITAAERVVQGFDSARNALQGETHSALQAQLRKLDTLLPAVEPVAGEAFTATLQKRWAAEQEAVRVLEDVFRNQAVNVRDGFGTLLESRESVDKAIEVLSSDVADLGALETTVRAAATALEAAIARVHTVADETQTRLHELQTLVTTRLGRVETRRAEIAARLDELQGAIAEPAVQEIPAAPAVKVAPSAQKSGVVGVAGTDGANSPF